MEKGTIEAKEHTIFDESVADGIFVHISGGKSHLKRGGQSGSTAAKTLNLSDMRNTNCLSKPS